MGLMGEGEAGEDSLRPFSVDIKLGDEGFVGVLLPLREGENKLLRENLDGPNDGEVGIILPEEVRVLVMVFLGMM